LRFCRLAPLVRSVRLAYRHGVSDSVGANVGRIQYRRALPRGNRRCSQAEYDRREARDVASRKTSQGKARICRSGCKWRAKVDSHGILRNSLILARPGSDIRRARVARNGKNVLLRSPDETLLKTGRWGFACVWEPTALWYQTGAIYRKQVIQGRTTRPERTEKQRQNRTPTAPRSFPLASSLCVLPPAARSPNAAS
jgi:hypothetical protein